jgi:hypothetical protein
MSMMSASKISSNSDMAMVLKREGISGHCHQFEYLTWFISSGESIIHALLLR